MIDDDFEDLSLKELKHLGILTEYSLQYTNDGIEKIKKCGDTYVRNIFLILKFMQNAFTVMKIQNCNASFGALNSDMVQT